MGRKYDKPKPGKDGWCAWQSPIHGHGRRNYRLSCCDCNLVHEMQFRVVRDTKGRNSVIFRVARNNRATAAMRRKK